MISTSLRWISSSEDRLYIGLAHVVVRHLVIWRVQNAEIPHAFLP